uniref:Uncharacterized protein n=1 Tax=Arundo donax TaxID=35708 RepID=A0A0A8ZGT8_ARUDO
MTVRSSSVGFLRMVYPILRPFTYAFHSSSSSSVVHPAPAPAGFFSH